MLVRLSIRSVKDIDKAERGNILHYEKYIECEFNLLPKMLVKDYIYNSFAYLGMKRKSNNICSSCNLLVLDVDHTNVSRFKVFDDIIKDCVQVIVSTTSDVNNDYKYRVLLPLDREVTPKEYKLLVHGIVENGLVKDIDVKASHAVQMMFAYKDSNILSNFNGEPLCVDDYILEPEETIYTEQELSTQDVHELIEEFKPKSAILNGKRTNVLLAIGFKLLGRGVSNAQLETVILAINSHFLHPKTNSEVRRRVINFIKAKRN